MKQIDDIAAWVTVLGIIAFIFSMFGAWVTHVLSTIAAEQWVLLVVGALIPPIGVIHGLGIWFGVV